MSFFCTVLDGTLLVNVGVLCIFGRLKLGILIVGCCVWVVPAVPAAGLRTPNGVALLLLPNGVDFTALDQKITQDTEDSSTGIVTYSYDGHELGTAKVKLSKSYLKAHTDSTQDESKSSGHDNSKKQTKSGKHLSLGTTKGKVILGLSILLVILIITFIATVFRIRKKSNKRKTNKRKKQ